MEALKAAKAAAVRNGIEVKNNTEQIQDLKPENQVPPTSPSILPRQYHANSGKAVPVRLPIHRGNSSSSLDLTQLYPSHHPETHHHNQRYGSQGRVVSLFSQVAEWLQQERSKASQLETSTGSASSDPSVSSSRQGTRTVDLDRLERILQDFAVSAMENGVTLPRQRSSTQLRRIKGLRRGSMDESDAEQEVQIPGADVVLDNSKTLGYNGGRDDANDDPNAHPKDKDNWNQFKSDIVRLAHTLGIKGWRRIPLETGAEIHVSRLSGALTNAVYVVSPPKNIPSGSHGEQPKKPPSQLLLRIYGPQVEHLIDRESELAILRRLGRKHIGPRLLGTFKNGRFEQFLNAKPLTFHDMRVPETSMQIAKRMRELHDGIELYDDERRAGPNVFRNWWKWVDRCEQVISWLDKEMLSPDNADKAVREPWRKVGLVCGVPWPQFRKAVESYQEYLNDWYGGATEINSRLVFAHSDTQYGNVLRLEPSTASPLILPANEHKQLVVIDFEYSSPNTRGLEFANHFTEWCYNYHHPRYSWACNTNCYPKRDEQERFIRAYLTHRPLSSISHSLAPPSTNASAASSTFSSPEITANRSPHIPPFTLDMPAVPPISAGGGGGSFGPTLHPVTSREEQDLEGDLRTLMHETRLWRPANSAQWVAWGIVQAEVPGMAAGITAMAEEAEAEAKAKAEAEAWSGPGTKKTDSEETGKEKESGTVIPMADSANVVAEPRVDDRDDKKGEGLKSKETTPNAAEEGEEKTTQDKEQEKEAETEKEGNGSQEDSVDPPQPPRLEPLPPNVVDPTRQSQQHLLHPEPQQHRQQEEDDGGEEFDYLTYAQDRAFFFWADMISLGLVQEDQLPPDVLVRVREHVLGY